MTDEAIVVESVDGLGRTANVGAIALVWENRIVIDAKYAKKPRVRRNILRHERRHIMNVRKRGMTARAGLVNVLIEMEDRWALFAFFVLFIALVEAFSFLGIALALTPFVGNYLYWRR